MPGSTAGAGLAADAAAPLRPIPLASGPHLLIDDHLIEAGKDVRARSISRSGALAGPVVPATEGYRNCQPWCTVVRDAATGKFRMWYNAHPGVEFPDNVYEGLYGTHFAVLDSDDGATWKAPYVWTKLPLTVDATVLDDGPVVCATRRALQGRLSLRDDEEAEQAREAAWPSRRTASLDVGRRHDPRRHQRRRGRLRALVLDRPGKRYGMFVRTNRKTPYRWTNREGRVLEMPCRVIGLSTSRDFRTWSRPQPAIAPDAKTRA